MVHSIVIRHITKIVGSTVLTPSEQSKVALVYILQKEIKFLDLD